MIAWTAHHVVSVKIVLNTCQNLVGIYFLSTFVAEKRNNTNNLNQFIMTSMNIFASDECFVNLQLCIEKLTEQGLVISYEPKDADEDGCRYVKVKSATEYGIYALGIEMGKLSTNHLSYV